MIVYIENAKLICTLSIKIDTQIYQFIGLGQYAKSILFLYFRNLSLR